jgi:hypothetical protein
MAGIGSRRRGGASRGAKTRGARRWHGVAAQVRLYYGWRILVGLLKRLERRLVSGFTREIPRRRCAARRKIKAYQKNYTDCRSVHVRFSS